LNGHAAHSVPLGLPPAAFPAPADATIELGKKLFFDTRLSIDGKISCAKCHIPQRAFTDGRTRSVGHEERVGTRNALSLLNVAYLSTLFWDGRATDLESQALGPLINPAEHAFGSEAAVVEFLRHSPEYSREFQTVFGISPAQISTQYLVVALSSYERTLLSGDSPFDRFFYKGDRNAISPAALRGFELFRGRAQCGGCHSIGESCALFTDAEFHMSPMGLRPSVSSNLPALTAQVLGATAQNGRRGLEQLIAKSRDVAALGRFLVTLAPADIGKFKTPSLRNVSLTGPYMHDGSVATLRKAVELELYARGSNSFKYPISLSTAEQEDLLEFLYSLTSSEFAAKGERPGS
jgi:cytochrome c peroxidase